MKNIFLFSLVLFFLSNYLNGQNEPDNYVHTTYNTGDFNLVHNKKAATLIVDELDYPGVIRALNDLKNDIGKVTGVFPEIHSNIIPEGNEIVIAGTLGKNPLINKLAKQKKIDITELQGKWEKYIIQIIDKPFKGVARALVIAGSDKRGTIYGIYDISEKIGVSPWYWWADVPAMHHDALFIKPGQYSAGEPAVKYRGIFINDEAPALSGWTNEKFGGFNHKLYEKVFELILRLKGNFLWPAMWGNAFYDDDSLNAKLADEYGIVIGTSHHEPMMRAHDEWRRYGSGPWNYEKNENALKEFWRKGIERMGTYESIVTLAMRGDGDLPMSDESNIALLEKIVADQRKILEKVTGKDISTIPQVWALYKEVQEYYDKGMRVPDDVTLLLCDDNWGNIRRVPPPDEKNRTGGYGMYYHFDFVGGPRNYKWLNTIQIQKVWEQMNIAYRYGINRIWIVNVGDIKPMEFPISFFLDYAWNPEKIAAEGLDDYTVKWAEKHFGIGFAHEIADIINLYTKYNSRRKPEMLSYETYSLINYCEAERIVEEYNALAEKADKIYNQIPSEYKDAYFQLVLFPVKACANLNELYVSLAKNYTYAKQNRNLTNYFAERVKSLFAYDSALTQAYHSLGNGKWNHMMSQTHIGYTSWQQPEKNIMPDVKKIVIPPTAEMGVAVEQSEQWWPNDTSVLILPDFTIYGNERHYFDIFNRGTVSFDFHIEIPVNIISANVQKGTVTDEQRIWLTLDKNKVPKGRFIIPISIKVSENKPVIVYAPVNNPVTQIPDNFNGFIENAGYASIEAEHYSVAVADSPIHWQIIPGLGRTLSGITPFPVTTSRQQPASNSPRLEYNIYFTDTGKTKVNTYFSPTLNFTGGSGFLFGISMDDEKPQIVNFHENENISDWKYPQWWNQSVSDNIKIKTTEHYISAPGPHVLKFWLVDPGLVLQKIVIDLGGVKPSYLGPPETFRIINKE
jgi:hypothetical protein